MSGKMTRSAYIKCIDEDLEWLKAQPNTLERRHIEEIVKASVLFEYPISQRSAVPDSEGNISVYDWSWLI